MNEDVVEIEEVLIDETQDDEIDEIEGIDIGDEIELIEVVDLAHIQNDEIEVSDDVDIMVEIEVMRDDVLVDEMVEMVEIDIFDDVDEQKRHIEQSEPLDVQGQVDVLDV